MRKLHVLRRLLGLGYSRNVVRAQVKAGVIARERWAEEVSAAHLLLAAIREPAPVLARVCSELGVSSEAVAKEIGLTLPPARLDPIPAARSCLTPSLDYKEVLWGARGDAAQCGAEYVGPEHLLLHAMQTESAVGEILRRRFPPAEELRALVGAISRQTAVDQADAPRELGPIGQLLLLFTRWLVRQNERRIKRQSRRS